MRFLPSRHRYVKWDGTKAVELDADEILGALADDVSEYGDLSEALRRMLSRGSGTQRRGLSSMLRELRERQSEHMKRFDLSSAMRDLKQQLDEILDMERKTIEEWQDREQGDLSNDVLKSIADRNADRLDNLPHDPAGKMNELKNYDFLNPEAQKKYLELLKQLRDAVTDSMFKNLSERINNMSDDEVQRMKDMVKALNEMLANHIAGDDDVGFEDFMDEFGDMFGDQPPESLDQLLSQMQQQMMAAQSLMWSMSRDQREQLAQMLGNRFDDEELNSELNKLQSGMEYLLPPGKSFGFRGDEELDLKTALELMEEMHKFDQLKDQFLRAERTGNLDKIDREIVKEILGEEADENLEDLQRIRKVLEDAGLIRQTDSNDWELTPLGARRIGFKALAEIYARLRNHQMGGHSTPEEGRFGDRIDQTKPYEFGDPMHIDLPQTIKNAIYRTGPKTPIELDNDDFEIHRSETVTSTATVMCLDLSTSMAMRGAFQSAKKVALALQHLITSQYPNDSFYIIGFDVLAREVKPHELLYLQWDGYMTGTNMEHALLLGDQLLSKHKVGTKQIILISDGEPTVHFEKGHTRFNYPPTRATLRATYKAVKRCTKKNIAINTFMLDSSSYFTEFIEEITRINGGRVFYTDPRRLGEYILVDYMNNKRTRIARQ